MRVRIMVAVLAAALLLPAGPAAVAGGGGFFTDARPYLVPLEKGVEITPIITAGGVVDGTPWYFTGEESPGSLRHGVSVAVQAVTHEIKPLPWFGHMYHENQVPVQGMSKFAFFLSEDGHPGRSQIWAYTAGSFHQALRG